MKSVFRCKLNLHLVILQFIAESTGLYLILTLALWLISITDAPSKTQCEVCPKMLMNQKFILRNGLSSGASILVLKANYFIVKKTTCLNGFCFLLRCLGNRFCLLNCLKFINTKTQKYNNLISIWYTESWILNYLFVRGP